MIQRYFKHSPFSSENLKYSEFIQARQQLSYSRRSLCFKLKPCFHQLLKYNSAVFADKNVLEEQKKRKAVVIVISFSALCVVSVATVPRLFSSTKSLTRAEVVQKIRSACFTASLVVKQSNLIVTCLVLTTVLLISK